MCSVLKVSRSGYYAWCKRQPSKRARENTRITEEIKEIFEQSRASYGSPRITEELEKRGFKASRPRGARLMRKAHIRSKLGRKFVVTTDSKHKFKVSPNLLDRNFEPGLINRAWVSDITYVFTRQGWLYLTVIIDLGDRRVIGWALSNSLEAEATVIPAWKMAILNRPPEEQTIFHSDRGVQYACNAFRSCLEQYPTQILQSMSGKGNCWDNAVAESFFKSLKYEWLKTNFVLSKRQAEMLIFEYIEIWYNRKRMHSALGNKSPEEFLVTINYKMAA